MNTVGTVIIGGGMAGLACARQLNEAGQDFILVTEQLAASVVTSDDGQVNYGAYYVTEDYHHVNQFVTLGRRITQNDFSFHTTQSSYTSFGKRIFKYYDQFARYKEYLHRLRPQLLAFRAACEHIDQAVTLRNNPELFQLFNMSARKFIDDNNFREFVDAYIGQIIFATAFTQADDLEAFDMLWLSFPMIVKTYEFTFHLEALTAPFDKRITIDTVTTFEANQSGRYIIHTTQSGDIMAKQVVVAAGTAEAQRLLHLPKINPPISAYMMHIRGSLKPKWSKRMYNVFHNTSPVRTLVRQSDGTYLMYAHNPNPDFMVFFDDYHIIAQKHWNPAFHLAGNTLLSCNQGKDLYLVGGHNICSLEDAYITGLFAANSIIKKSN